MIEVRVARQDIKGIRRATARKTDERTAAYGDGVLGKVSYRLRYRRGHDYGIIAGRGWCRRRNGRKRHGGRVRSQGRQCAYQESCYSYCPGRFA